jgi:hypothetical protein
MRCVLGDGLVADEAAKIAREQRQLRLGLRAVLRVEGDAEAEIGGVEGVVPGRVGEAVRPGPSGVSSRAARKLLNSASASAAKSRRPATAPARAYSPIRSAELA